MQMEYRGAFLLGLKEIFSEPGVSYEFIILWEARRDGNS